LRQNCFVQARPLAERAVATATHATLKRPRFLSTTVVLGAVLALLASTPCRDDRAHIYIVAAGRIALASRHVHDRAGLLSLEEPAGVVVLTVSCTFSAPTADDAASKSKVSCTSS
jgi:hypothetical protein